MDGPTGADAPREGRGPRRLAVLASGSGTNFQALLDAFASSPDAPVEPAVLVASRPGIGALERARRAGVPSEVLPEETRERRANGSAGPEPGGGGERRAAEASWLLRTLREAGAEIVVLAGYLRKVPPAVVRAYWGAMLNVHPALLPSFGGRGMYGSRVHRAVLESGVRVTGVTVHFVDEAYDRGPILAQWPVPVLPGDDADRLAARVLAVEHRLLPAAVRALATGAVRLTDGGEVEWSAPPFEGERFELRGGPVRSETGRSAHGEE